METCGCGKPATSRLVRVGADGRRTEEAHCTECLLAFRRFAAGMRVAAGEAEPHRTDAGRRFMEGGTR